MYDEFVKIREASKDSKKKPEIKDALWLLGFGEREDEVNTVQLLDNRTFDIINNYLYYKTDPTKAFNDPPTIWKESVIILNDIFQQRLF